MVCMLYTPPLLDIEDVGGNGEEPVVKCGTYELENC